MEQFKQLLAHCKCGVFLTVNGHKNDYESVQEYLSTIRGDLGITPEMKAKMIELDTVVELIFYPDTPIGSYRIYHYDVALALEAALLTFGP